MKTPMTKTLTVAILLQAVLLSSGAAKADYYTREDVVRCQNQERNTEIGAAVGGLLGALSGRGGRLNLPGAIIGAAAGGLIGAGLSCHEQVQYVDHMDRCLDSDESEDQWEGGRVTIVQTFLGPEGQVCKEYRSTIYSQQGQIMRDEVACRGSAGWIYGYHPEEFRVVDGRDYRYRDDRREYYRDDEDRRRFGDRDGRRER